MTLLGMSQTYRSRPSELLHIDDPYTAYCIDEAVFVYHALLHIKENKEAQKTEALSITSMRGVETRPPSKENWRDVL